MVFLRGILSFTELRLFLKDISCTNIVPFDKAIIQVNELYPVAFYNLKELDDYRMFIDGPELIHVLYLCTYTENISLMVDLMETPVYFILVIGEYVKNEDFVDEIDHHLIDYITPINSEYAIIHEWETLLSKSTDNADTKRDAALKELVVATREQLMLKNNPMSLSQKVLEIVQKDSQYIQQSDAAYKALNDAVAVQLQDHAHPSQPARVHAEIVPPIVDLVKPSVLTEVSITDHSKRTKESTKKDATGGIVANDRADVIAARTKEKELNKLRDYVSLFISSACGSVGFNMVDAFVDLPTVGNILHNRRAYEDYLNTLSPTVKYAIQSTDGWIRAYSASGVGINDVVGKFYESTLLIERQIYMASVELCGQYIKNGHLENPKRGMQTTRFNIPSTLRNMSNALDVLRDLLPSYSKTNKKPKIEFSNLIFKD